MMLVAEEGLEPTPKTFKVVCTTLLVVPPRFERGTWGSKPRELPLLQGTHNWWE